MKEWEVVANNLKKTGFNLGWVSALDLERRTVWTVDAHRDGKRFVVRADEKLNCVPGARDCCGGESLLYPPLCTPPKSFQHISDNVR